MKIKNNKAEVEAFLKNSSLSDEIKTGLEINFSNHFYNVEEHNYLQPMDHFIGFTRILHTNNDVYEMIKLLHLMFPTEAHTIYVNTYLGIPFIEHTAKSSINVYWTRNGNEYTEITPDMVMEYVKNYSTSNKSYKLFGFIPIPFIRVRYSSVAVFTN